MAGNDRYATDLLRADIESDDEGLDAGCDDGSFFSAGDDDVSTTSLCDNDRVDMSYEVMHNIPMSGALKSMPGPPEITNENGIIDDTTVPLPTNNNDSFDDEDYHSSRPPKGKSITHFHLQAGECAFVSFDAETGGDLCGIV
mmetsp:Transcript_21081/g.44710  ORF Transcript_21081/g.44710 Transcript_21081/m.44710 type:complete len:142 (+) Transcript_21081:190-615(+)